FFFLFALRDSHLVGGLLCSILLGVLAGFLLLKPAKTPLALGSSSVLLVAYIIGNVAILLGYADISHQKVVLLTPIIILLHPIMYGVFIFVAKVVKEKKILFLRSEEPFALVFLEKEGEQKNVARVSLTLILLSGITALMVYILNSNAIGLFSFLILFIIIATIESFIFFRP
ncbi:hypothetical protein ACFLQ1_00950, partial [Candidatus Auribacterota bacterium]